MFPVLVFIGGEDLPPSEEERENHTFLVSEWSVEEIRRVMGEFYGPIQTDDGEVPWQDSEIDNPFISEPLTCGKTVEIINNNLAQAYADPYDGGVLYVVRC